MALGQQRTKGRQAVGPTVRCRGCGGVLQRQVEKVVYVYPSPDELPDLHAGAYYCAVCAEEAFRRLEELSILIVEPPQARWHKREEEADGT